MVPIESCVEPAALDLPALASVNAATLMTPISATGRLRIPSGQSPYRQQLAFSEQFKSPRHDVAPRRPRTESAPFWPISSGHIEIMHHSPRTQYIYGSIHDCVQLDTFAHFSRAWQTPQLAGRRLRGRRSEQSHRRRYRRGIEGFVVARLHPPGANLLSATGTCPRHDRLSSSAGTPTRRGSSCPPRQ